MSKPLVNIGELEYTTFGKGEKFQAERALVSPHIGARKLGYAVVRKMGSDPNGTYISVSD